jgi:electron transfer flavoprotein beta subunit
MLGASWRAAMKVLVPAKQVAGLREDFVLAGAERPAPEALEWGLNESDEHALETALLLVESSGGGELVVASVGPAQAEAGLRACLAKGATRAVRVWGDSLSDADALGVAEVLAALAAREQPDLIVCGVQSSDTAAGATPAALAGLLDLPRVVAVGAARREDDQLVVERELEGGAVEVLRIGLPALLSVQSAPGRPRQANLRAIKHARSAAVETLLPEELGLDEARLREALGARLVRLSEPARGTGAQMLDGTPVQIAARIAEIIAVEMSS